jgi:hypothetical protein
MADRHVITATLLKLRRDNDANFSWVQELMGSTKKRDPVMNWAALKTAVAVIALPLMPFVPSDVAGAMPASRTRRRDERLDGDELG